MVYGGRTTGRADVKITHRDGTKFFVKVQYTSAVNLVRRIFLVGKRKAQVLKRRLMIVLDLEGFAFPIVECEA
jgi:hypothetical protein